VHALRAASVGTFLSPPGKNGAQLDARKLMSVMPRL